MMVSGRTKAKWSFLPLSSVFRGRMHERKSGSTPEPRLRGPYGTRNPSAGLFPRPVIRRSSLPLPKSMTNNVLAYGLNM
jgi:hypothetical protein